jgi:hypothetical protein
METVVFNRNEKIKKAYFMVMCEFYADGTVKAGMKPEPSLCREKPAALFREFPGMNAYTDWYERRADAERAVREAREASGRSA